MSDHSKDKKIAHPQDNFDHPSDILKDRQLSSEEKRDALDTWEQDANQLLTASNEGMPGSEEGIDSKDNHQLGAVVRAKDKIGVKPQRKASH
jgi:hypothetical protein